MKAKGYYVTRKNIGHSIVDMEWEIVSEGEIGEFSPPFILDEEYSKKIRVFIPLDEEEFLIANALNACVGTVPYSWSQVGYALEAENRARVLELTPDVLRRNSSNAVLHRALVKLLVEEEAWKDNPREEEDDKMRWLSAQEMEAMYGDNAITIVTDAELAALELRRKLVICDESRPVGFKNGSEFGLMLTGPEGPGEAVEVHCVKNSVWHHQTRMDRNKVRDSKPDTRLEWVNFSVSPPQPVEYTLTSEGEDALAKL